MVERPTIRSVIGLPPDDTVRAFEARGKLHATVHWSEMWHEDHARAFTVAKVANLDLLGEIQSSLADVLANGGTFQQWQANLVPHLQATGWWGEVQDRALTGTDDVVHVGARRLRTIYDTNLRVSRAAGQWKRIQELKDARPFLRYTAVMDSRTRPEHRRWHGTILPVDHEWWDTHFPPCGWYCRCTVRQLSQRELDAKGWKVSPVPDDGPPVLFKPAGRAAAVEVPRGISPGFGYNPGKTSMRAVTMKATESIERAAPRDLAAARSTLDELVRSDAFLETLHDPAGAVPVGVLDDELVAITGATNRVVVMSSYNYAKQLGKVPGNPGHPELTIADYKILPRLFAGPEKVFADRPGKAEFVLSGMLDGRRWRAAFKVLPDQGELFLLSFRRGNEGDVARDAKWPNLLRGGDAS